MHHGERLLIVEVLTHGSGSIGAGCKVGIARVAPVLDHAGHAQSGVAAQVAGVVIGDDLHALIEVQGLKIPLVPARNHGAVHTGGLVDLGQERGKVLDLFGDGPAVGVGHGLVVVDDLGGVQERQSHLLALELGAQQQTSGEVIGVITGALDVGVQVLKQAAVAVGSNVVGVGDGDRRQAGSGRVGSHQSLVDVLVRADVLGLDGDEALGLVELLDHVGHQIVVLRLQRVPPGNGDGFGDLILAGVRSLGSCRAGCGCGRSRRAGLASGAAARARGQCCRSRQDTSSGQKAATRDLFHSSSFFPSCFGCSFFFFKSARSIERRVHGKLASHSPLFRFQG